MNIKSIHFKIDVALLDQNKSFVRGDLSIQNTGDFSYMTTNKYWQPVINCGITSFDNFNTLNSLINRKVFTELSPVEFEQQMKSKETKSVERLSIRCCYEDFDKDEFMQLEWDINPFTRSSHCSLPKFLTEMMCDIGRLISYDIVGKQEK